MAPSEAAQVVRLWPSARRRAEVGGIGSFLCCMSSAWHKSRSGLAHNGWQVRTVSPPDFLSSGSDHLGQNIIHQELCHGRQLLGRTPASVPGRRRCVPRRWPCVCGRPAAVSRAPESCPGYSDGNARCFFPSFKVLILPRNPHAMTTRPSTGRMPTGTTSMSPASAPRPVLGTAVFARTVLWTSKRASSESELFVIVHSS